MFNKRYKLLFSEKNVVDVLNIVNNYTKTPLTVGSCGWADEDTWVINFSVNSNSYTELIKDLIDSGTLETKENKKRRELYFQTKRV